MRVNLVRDDAHRVVGLAWRLGRRTGLKVRKTVALVPVSACACGEDVCDCGCDCDA